MQAADTCGNLNSDCCYDQPGQALCGVGLCDPGTPKPPLDNYKAFPCLCSNTICVKNAEYCEPGAICDQTAILEECGGNQQPCCDGIQCNEDDYDEAGRVLALECDQSFYDAATGQSTKCAADNMDGETLDQSFGTGGAGEKCTGGDSCDLPELSCQGARRAWTCCA